MSRIHRPGIDRRFLLKAGGASLALPFLHRLVGSRPARAEAGDRPTRLLVFHHGQGQVLPFFTPTGFGTVVAEGKETREFDGVPCVLETGLTADFALVKAWKGDTHGNLVFRATARNFNPMMATAGRVTIAEVEEVVEPGALDPDTVHTPGIFVQRVVLGTQYEKRIEKRTIREA